MNEINIDSSREAEFDDVNFDEVYLSDIDTCHEVRFDDANADNVYIGELSHDEEFFYIVVIKDNKAHMTEFREAIDTELNGLREKEVFKDVKRSSFSPEQIENMLIIKAKLILGVKEPGLPDERKDVRIAAQAVGSKD